MNHWWTSDLDAILFHYTDREVAIQIAAEGAVRVGPGSHYGISLGIYATEIPPSSDNSPADICAQCFDDDGRAEAETSAVVVVRREFGAHRFEQVEHAPHIYKQDGHWEEEIPVAVIDVLAWDGTDWQPVDWE